MSEKRTSRYRDLLKEPAWLARRSQILYRADYRCEECRAAESESTRLEVHHRHYRAGAYPWQYEDMELVCLCTSCHEILTDHLERARKLIGQLPITAFQHLFVALNGMLLQSWPKNLPIYVDDGSEDGL